MTILPLTGSCLDLDGQTERVAGAESGWLRLRLVNPSSKRDRDPQIGDGFGILWRQTQGKVG